LNGEEAVLTVLGPAVITAFFFEHDYANAVE
jgi:hypothetical protein